MSRDPTADWPAAGLVPTLDLERHGVGPMRLGDPFEDAKAFGRPERVRSPASGGSRALGYEIFELEFQDDRLVCVKLDIGRRGGVTVGDFRLSHSTKPLDVLAWFGEPASDSTDGGELRWIDFVRDGATLALEFDGNKLGCVQLYAAGYA